MGVWSLERLFAFCIFDTYEPGSKLLKGDWGTSDLQYRASKLCTRSFDHGLFESSVAGFMFRSLVFPDFPALSTRSGSVHRADCGPAFVADFGEDLPPGD